MTHAKTKAKQIYFEHIFKNTRNTSDTWKCINRLLRKTKPKSMFPQTIEAGGKSITTLKNICNEINSEQTADHIISACPLHRAPKGIQGLLVLDDDTRRWLKINVVNI